MTKAERKKHRSEVIRGAANLLRAEADNGSGWLYYGIGDGLTDLNEETVSYRLSVLDRLAASIERKAGI